MEQEYWRKNIDQNIKSNTGRWELFFISNGTNERTYTEGWKETRSNSKEYKISLHEYSKHKLSSKRIHLFFNERDHESKRKKY